MTPEHRRELARYITEHPLQAIAWVLLPMLCMRMFGPTLGIVVWLLFTYVLYVLEGDRDRP